MNREFWEIILLLQTLQVPVSAFGTDGQLILGLFIPLSILVIVLCVGRACWTWHLEHSLHEWTYDPYLDLSLRNKHPGYVAPPSSRGRVVLGSASESYRQELLVTNAKAMNAKRTSALAFAAHRLGTAMRCQYQEDPPCQRELILSPSNFADCSHHHHVNISPENLDDDSHLTQKSPHRQRFQDDSGFFGFSPASLKEPGTTFESSKTYLNSCFVPIDCETSKPMGIKQALNPYGQVTQILSLGNTSESPAYSSTLTRSNSLGHCAKLNASSLSLHGRKPSFSTFMQVYWNRLKTRTQKILAKKLDNNTTSKSLQKDVKINEEKTMHSLFTLRENLHGHAATNIPVSDNFANNFVQPSTTTKVENPTTHTTLFKGKRKNKHIEKNVQISKPKEQMLSQVMAKRKLKSCTLTNRRAYDAPVQPGDQGYINRRAITRGCPIAKDKSRTNAKLRWQKLASLVKRETAKMEDVTEDVFLKDQYNKMFDELFAQAALRER